MQKRSEGREEEVKEGYLTASHKELHQISNRHISASFWNWVLKFWEGGDLLPIRSFPVSFVLAEHLRRDTHHHFYAIIEKFQNNFTYDKYGCRYPLPRSPEMSPVTKDPGNGRITTQIKISQNLSTQLQKLVEIGQFE